MVSARRESEMDREANVFAMELLMPEKMLRSDVEKLRGVELDLACDKLAEMYQVEKTVMVIRLTQLGYFK